MLNSPPCTTKKRLQPEGLRMGAVSVVFVFVVSEGGGDGDGVDEGEGGGLVAEMRVESGTLGRIVS